MAIHIFKSTPELIKALADYVVHVADESITSRGEFNFVLSGGSSPKLLYEKLASPEYEKQLEWSKVNFFFGDERCVPANDPRNNANMVRRVLFEPLNILTSKIFAIDTSLPPADAAKNYTTLITSNFKGKAPRFDLILLGLGDNAHTASLFPYTDVLKDKSSSVQSVVLKEQNSYRITMTAPLINQAHHIAFLVYGSAKAEALHQIVKGEPDFEKYPAQLIKPANGDLQWYLDKDAALLIK